MRNVSKQPVRSSESSASSGQRGALLLVALAAVLFAVVDFVVYQWPILEPRIALGGWGPEHYVAQKLSPDNFANDWQGGIRAYDASLAMHAYVWLAEWAGIEPTRTMYPYVLIETLFLSLSVAFLAQTLFGNPIVSILASALTLGCPLFGLNLGRFGLGMGGFPAELYYGFAHAFCLLGFSFCLRRQLIPAATSLALAANIHMAMAALATLFVAPLVLQQKDIFRDRRFWLAGLVFIVLSIPVMRAFVGSTQGRAQGPSLQEWVDASRFFCFHWFPISLGVFSSIAHEELVPFLLVVLLLFQSLRRQDLAEPGTQFAITGTAVAVAAAVVGVVCSDVFPIPFVIRLCPQRMTAFVTILGCLFGVRYLYEKIAAGNLAIAAMAAFTYITFLVARPGIAILPLLLLLAADVIGDRRLGPIPLSGRGRAIAASVLSALILVLLTFPARHFATGQDLLDALCGSLAQAWPPFGMLNPFADGRDFLLRGGYSRHGIGVAAVLGLSLLVVALTRAYALGQPAATFASLAAALTLVVGVFAWDRHADAQSWLAANGNRGRAFLEMQRWCRDHTPRDAVFLVNPGGGYGWRDFAQRGSFGVFREWVFTSFAYSTGVRSWAEANERMRLFDLDLAETLRVAIAKKTPSDVVRRQATEVMTRSFCNLDPERLARLREVHGVRYVVAHRSAVPHSTVGLETVRENDEYLLFAIRIGAETAP